MLIVESEKKKKNSRNPNHSRQNVGVMPEKNPWAEPSRVLAIHRCEILEMFAATT